MTREEYDTWEKTDKLAAQSWLSNATRKSSQVQESRVKVLKKYKNWVAEIQGIDEPSKELQAWDRIEKSRPDLKSRADWPEKVMELMEQELNIKTPEPVKIEKSKVLKPDYSSGKTGNVSGSGKKKLSAEEFEALPEEQQREYLMAHAPR
jgi:hypothetical protein